MHIIQGVQYFEKDSIFSMWHLHILCFCLASRHSNSTHAISSLTHTQTHTPFALLIMKKRFLTVHILAIVT